MDGGFPYRARVTLLVGVAAAHACLNRWNEQGGDQVSRLTKFIEKHKREMLLWGESAIPFFVCHSLWLERRGQSGHAEGVIQMLVEAITNLNAPGSNRGLPAPYYGVNRCVAALCRVASDPTIRDCPTGASFTLAPLIHFLVRRGRKQTLKALWPAITRIHLAEHEYKIAQDFYLWRLGREYEGHLIQRYVKRPQHWGELVTEASGDAQDLLPSKLRVDHEFSMMFMLVYPHRFNRAFLKLVENGEGGPASAEAQSDYSERSGEPNRRIR